MDEVSILRLTQDECGRDRFIVKPTPANCERVKAWLRGLGDGYILFDRADLFAKVEGPLVVEEVTYEQCLALDAGIEPLGGLPAEASTPGLSAVQLHATAADHFELRKPYFVGQHALADVRVLSLANGAPTPPEFTWHEPENAPLKRTQLYDWHRAHTKHIVPFAGWEMPVWYTGVLDEHNAVRKAAGLFDVSHMGVFEASGPHAEAFLDLVCTNYTRWYAPGESFYSYLLDPDGKVIDDLLVYRRNRDRFQIVVNASNADKDWAWLNAVNNGEVLLDRERPDLRVLRPAVLRDLKDPASGPDMRIDLALQGPASLSILQSLTDDPRLKAQLGRVRKTGVTECVLAGFRPGDRPHRLHRRGDGLRALRPSRPGCRVLGDAAGSGQAVRAATDRAGRTRQHAHRGRPAALRPRVGRALRHLTRGRALRRLRQAAQALLHRPVSLHAHRSRPGRWRSPASA